MLQAHLRLTPEDYGPADWSERLQRQFLGLLRNSASSFVLTLAQALGFVNRVGESAALLEAHLGLTPEDYRAADLSARLQRQLLGLRSDKASGCVLSLAQTLPYH